jgi:hypothetical protein
MTIFIRADIAIFCLLFFLVTVDLLLLAAVTIPALQFKLTIAACVFIGLVFVGFLLSSLDIVRYTDTIDY